ncbi:MAG TPA: AsmA-like C-terminal region-containing protein, partial [Candidatus Manganitrophaceae bacterium]|nr:AsmA-like C-terminal region-containing protein [Candidatus Manganitrophaceae bacterium]
FIPQIEQALGRKVDVGSVRLSLWPFGLRVRNVVIQDDPLFSEEAFLKVDSIILNARLLPLLRRELQVDELTFQKPVVTFLQNKEGKWNLSTLGGKREAPPSPRQAPAPGEKRTPPGIGAEKVRVKDGSVHFIFRGSSAGKAVRVDNLNLYLSDLGLGKTASLRLEADLKPHDKKLQLRGKMGPMTPALRPSTIEWEGRIGGSDFRLTGGFQRGRLILNADSRQIDLDELALLLPQSAPPGGGAAKPPKPSPPSSSPKADIDFNLKKILVKGIEATNLSGKIAFDREGGSIRNLAGDIWGGHFTGSGRVGAEVGTFPFSTAFTLEQVSFGALAKQFASVNPDLFSGKASVQLKMRGIGGSWSELAKTLTAEGAWEVGVGEIKNVSLLRESLDALQSLKGVEAPEERKTPFSSAKGEFRIEGGRIRLDPLFMRSELFDLTANGDVGLSGAYRFTGAMKLAQSISQRVKNTPLGTLVPTQEGRALVPIEIAGDARSTRLALREESLQKEARRKLRERMTERLFKNDLGGRFKR